MRILLLSASEEVRAGWRAALRGLDLVEAADARKARALLRRDPEIGVVWVEEVDAGFLRDYEGERPLVVSSPRNEAKRRGRA